ncbi:uncharacterized protein SPAPADRAFT_49916 [Spathaspora passalidarum NRRL Y-27907]|uniref:Uncharacterized protein n=1 Tax=Spathaspora passalidarum (strain NRRL Y-27907 / 11-Y1) TaxID=619300 RepID=G3AKT2_SPAPN|nr:uncharacterized protein SPAPADRAFT_49916 [Spathaspora passalidarum NRRL Y-27907]EGW32987.1 hypothetical protein SPAPADRAFT_49916 [Spathaspora passalidarum NRRL Y-27907]
MTNTPNNILESAGSSISTTNTSITVRPNQQSTTNNSSNNNNNNTNSNNSNTSLASTYKWVRKLRTLPSNPKSNDFLKLDYIEVNLNNSRKLIANVLKMSHTSQEYTDCLDLQIGGNLVQLTQVKKELDWLDDI